MRRLFLISAPAVVLFAAGCGGGGGGETATAAAGATAKVSMKSIQFNPKTLVIQKGTTVVWTNDDSVKHDVTKDLGPGPRFQSGTGDIDSGGSYRQTFNTPGTIKYECTVHPGMTGTIVVK